MPNETSSLHHVEKKQLPYSLQEEETIIFGEKSSVSDLKRVTTEQMENIDINRVGTSDESIYTRVDLGEGNNANTEVQIIAVDSEEAGQMIDGEMIELVIPEDGTDVRNFVTIETSKAKHIEM